MYNSIAKFIDIVFKSMGILFMVLIAVFVVVTVKSCSSTVETLDQIQKGEYNRTK